MSDYIVRSPRGTPELLFREGKEYKLDGLNSWERDVTELGHEAAYILYQQEVHKAQGRGVR